MRPSEALAKHREKVLEIIARYPVSNPRIFGSVARGEDVEGSDVDILVDSGGLASTFDLAGLELELESLLRLDVDIRTPGDLSGDVAARVARDVRAL
jgi:predicted nucleotidyltransferase